MLLLKAREERERWEEARAASPHIQVQALVGVFSYLYERVRTFVEFPDEHLIRRRAIERILKRRTMFSIERGDDFAKSLLTELITARYLPNDWVLESAITNIASIVAKYQALARGFKGKMQGGQDLCLVLASREIEEALLPRFEDEALVESAVKVLEQTGIAGDASSQTRSLLLEVAARQTLIREDQDTIYFALLKKIAPEFSNPVAPSPEAVKDALVFIKRLLRHPALPFLNTRVRTVRPIFLLVQSTLLRVSKEILQDCERRRDLELKIQDIIFERFEKAKKARFWSIIRVLIYIFLSKILLLLLLELPYEKYLAGGIQTLPILINLIAPPMFILILTGGVRSPKVAAVSSMIEEVRVILHEGRFAQAGKRLMRERRARHNPFFRGLFWLLYALFSFAVLVSVGYGISRLKFSVLGLAVFYTFMSLVGFFGYRIRSSFADAVPLRIRDPLFVTFFDLLFLPFMHLGRYMARTFQKINVVVVFLDMLIEVPFKAFFGVMEDWLTFVKEKKEDITRDS